MYILTSYEPWLGSAAVARRQLEQGPRTRDRLVGDVDVGQRMLVRIPPGVDVMNFLRFLPIFGEKIGVFLKNQRYDLNFA
jgi:hypothetical protein